MKWVLIFAVQFCFYTAGCTVELDKTLNTAEAEGDQPGECSDEADNDLDGLFDCADDQCAGSPACAAADQDAMELDSGSVPDATPMDSMGPDMVPTTDAETMTDQGGGPDVLLDLGRDADTSPGDGSGVGDSGFRDAVVDLGDDAAMGVNAFRRIALTLVQRFTLQGTFANFLCTGQMICDCDNRFEGDGELVESADGRLTFEGHWTLIESDCHAQFVSLTWFPNDGDAFHSFHLNDDATRVRTWITHRRPMDTNPLPNPVGNQQFYFEDMDRPIDEETLSFQYQSSTDGRISNLALYTNEQQLSVTFSR